MGHERHVMFMARGVMFSIASHSIWYIAKPPAGLKSLLWLTVDVSVHTGKTGWPKISLDKDARERSPLTSQPVHWAAPL